MKHFLLSIAILFSLTLTSQNIISNGDFSSTSSWNFASNAAIWSNANFARSAPNYAPLPVNTSSGNRIDNGYGEAYQSVSIPANASSGTLTFWASISTNETNNSVAYDKLDVYVAGSKLITLSNINWNNGYVQYSLNLTNINSIKGSNVMVSFIGTTDGAKPTIFRIDDVSLYVSTSGGGCTPVTISAQPQSQSITEGQTASLSVSASGTSPFTYQWYKNGAQISGANSPTLILNNVQYADNGSKYECYITNCNNTASKWSTSATLSVNQSCVGASIISHPSDLTVSEGVTANFIISTNGSIPQFYQWYKNGSQISGATNPSYSTPILSLSDNNSRYYCQVTNCSGTKTINSNSATLTVNSKCDPVSIVSQPIDISISEGNSASFYISTNGSSPIIYQWYKNGNPISSAISSNYTTPILSILDNNSNFYCKVSNCNGSKVLNSASANLTVKQAVNNSEINLITQEASLPMNVTPGSSVQLKVKVKNVGTKPSNPCAISVHLSEDQFYNASDKFLNDIVIPSLVQNQSNDYTLTISIPGSTLDGKKYILVSVDGNEKNEESNETDNRLAKEVNIISCYPEIDEYRSETPYDRSNQAYINCMNRDIQVSDADVWGMYQYQCVSYVCFKVNKSWGYNYPKFKFNNYMTVPQLSDAKNWATRLAAKGYLVDKNPKVGAIAWWDGYNGDVSPNGAGKLGHVAFVDCVDGDKITLSEYNWDRCNYGRREVNISQAQVSGNRYPDKYIHAEIGAMGEENEDVLSILELKDNEIEIFPNPAKDIFYLNLKNAKLVKSIYLINNLGVLISLQNFEIIDDQIKLNVSFFSPGLYFLKVNFEENSIRSILQIE